MRVTIVLGMNVGVSEVMMGQDDTEDEVREGLLSPTSFVYCSKIY